MAANRNRVLGGEISAFRRAVGYQAVHPPNGDMYFRDMAEAMYIETAPDGVMRPSIIDMLQWRTESMFSRIDPSGVAPNLVTRAIHKQALKRIGKENYLAHFKPQGQRSVKRWRNFIGMVVNDKESDDFETDLAIRTVQSNKQKRGRAQKIMASAFPERFGLNPSFFEPGCSLNLILKWLAEGEDTGVTVLDDESLPDPEMTRKINALLAGRLAIKSSLGVDEWSFQDDPAVEEWEIACSITPNDMLKRPEEVEETYHLLASEPAEVYFHKADFTYEQDIDNFPPEFVYRKRVPHSGEPRPIPFKVKKFDGAFSSTTSYLLSQEGQIKLAHIMESNTTPWAIIANQDFGTPKRDAPCGLRTAKNIYRGDFIYNYVYYDKLNPEAGWQLGFTWDGGRCEQLKIGNGGVMVDGEVVTIRRRLEEVTV